MKVYIGVCGIGMGHAGRCKAIGKQLEKEGANVIFSTYGSAYNYLENDFTTLFSPDILWEEKSNGSPDPWRSFFKSPILMEKFIQHVKKEKAFINKFEPDVILSDNRYSTLLAGGLREIPSYFLTNQTKAVLPDILFKAQGQAFVTWLWSKILKLSEKIFVPDLPLPYSLTKTCLNLKQDPEKYEFVGFCGRKYPEELPKKEKLKKEIGVKSPFILITISGPGISRNAIINFLRETFKNDNEKYILLNKGNIKNKGKEKRKGRLIEKSWLENIYKYIKASDLVISRSGLSTLSELVIYGRKSILIPLKGQPEQEENAKNAERLGISKIIDQDKLLRKDMNKIVEVVLEDKNIEKNLNKLQEMGQSYRGVERISEEIMKSE